MRDDPLLCDEPLLVLVLLVLLVTIVALQGQTAGSICNE